MPEAPLRATCSKSQPPHLVFGCFYYCLLNLSSDHLLSGVKRRLSPRGFRVKYQFCCLRSGKTTEETLANLGKDKTFSGCRKTWHAWFREVAAPDFQ